MQELSDYSFLFSRFTNIVVKPISSQQPQATSLLQVSICQGIPRSALHSVWASGPAKTSLNKVPAACLMRSEKKASSS